MTTPKHHYQFWVYIMASRSNVLYVGMTNNLSERVKQHQEGKNEGFTKKYNCKRLLYYEEFQYVFDAIARENQIKKWNRSKKEHIINEMNPEWKDLSREWLT